MSDLQEFATIRGTAQQLKDLIRQASAGYHDTIYLRAMGDDDTVQTIAQTDARQVMSYCTFNGLKEVSGDAEAILPTGLDNDTKGILDYLGIAEGTGVVEMTLLGEESGGDHPRLASYWQASGALETRVRLPGSSDDLQKVPWLLPSRWTSSDEYLSRSALDENGDVAVDEDEIENHIPPTEIETTADTVRDQIIQTADFMDAVNYYPLVVRDGEFRIELEGDTGDDRIRGQVNAESVDGPDVEQAFDQGFKELFGELSGPVTLATAPQTAGDDPDPPLVVTQTDHAGKAIRHVLGPFTED